MMIKSFAALLLDIPSSLIMSWFPFLYQDMEVALTARVAVN